MSCISKITSGITYDCVTTLNQAKAGLESVAVLINKSDIDYTSLTTSGAVITNLTLLSGKTGYELSWIKQLGNATSEFTVNETGYDTFQQSFISRVFGSGAADAKIIQDLSAGEFVLVVESKYKGAALADRYKVFGIDNGLKMEKGTYNTAENDASFVFTLSSLKGMGERFPYQVYFSGTAAASKIKFDNKFA